MAVKTRIIRIGNSRGVRIPKVLLDQSGISGEVELEVVQNGIVIHSVSHPRAGWEEGFASAAEPGDDELLIPDDLSTNWATEEWQWE